MAKCVLNKIQLLNLQSQTESIACLKIQMIVINLILLVFIEVCKSQADKYQYASKRTCRSYWECQGGISEPRCCPWGHSYLDGRGCIEDSTCEIPDFACSVDHKSLLIEWEGKSIDEGLFIKVSYYN